MRKREYRQALDMIFFITGQIWESFLGKLLLVDFEKWFYFLMNGWLGPLMVHISYF